MDGALIMVRPEAEQEESWNLSQPTHLNWGCITEDGILHYRNTAEKEKCIE